MDWGKKWLVDFNVEKTQLVSYAWCNNTDSIDVKMDGSAHEEKSSFKMLGLSFSYMISIPILTSDKIEALICSMKFLSPESHLGCCP